MPDFDKQLNPIIKEQVKKPLDLTSRAPIPYSPSFTSEPSIGTDQPSVFDKLNFATRNSNPIEKGIFITNKELAENKRYRTFNPTIGDYEDFAGYGQSAVDQLANGVVKMAGTAVGTFLQGFATIPNTIAALKNGKAADLSGGPNSYEAAIDSWTKNLEDEFPNYYTKHETEHPFLSAVPFSGGFSNFWGDKVIKNIGFTAGAISSAIVQDFAVGMVTEGIGEIPLIGAQIGKASLYLNKLFSAETKVGRALGATGKSDLSILLEQASKEGVTGAKLLDLKKLQQIGEYTKLTTGFRYGMSLYGSARTEAAVEARDGYNQVKSELIKQFKEDPLNNGAEPFGKDLEDIEDAATNAMNTRFGINMAILTVSNAIQFDNLFKSFTSASNKGFTSSITRDFEQAGKIGLKDGSLDVFEKKVTTGVANKVWDFVKPKLTNAFTEGVFEEGGQYAAERGTIDYYTRRYNQKKNTDPKKAKHWDTLNEIANSTVTGLTDQFGSKDGIENMFIGALSALVTGAGMKAIDRVKGNSGDKRLQSSINILNQYGLTGILANQYKDTVNSVGIAADMEEAVRDKNVFKYKNLKHDMFFNFVNSRLGNDMHDVTIEQLNMLKDLPKEEFEKTFGMDFSDSNKSTVAGYVDALIFKANNIKKSSDVINNTFKNPFKKSINPKTDAEKLEGDKHDKFNDWKTELKYQTSRSEDTKDRLSSIQQRVSRISPLIDNTLLATLTSPKSLKELSKSYEEQATEIGSTIDSLLTPEAKKEAKDKVKTLRSLSEKINIAINNKTPDLKLFGQLLNFEANDQDSTQDDVISPEYLVDLHEFGNDINNLRQRKAIAAKAYEILSSKEGFEKYYALDEEEEEKTAPTPTQKPTTATTAVVTPTTTHTFVNKAGDKEIAQIGKEYEVPSSKVAKISKIDDDRWQVTAPNGDVTFHSTEEKAKEEADELNQDVADLAKVKVIALNPDGTFKVEDLAGNIQNISADRLQGYERLKTEQEKLEKDKEEILNQQSEIVKDSGNVGTNNPANDKDVPEGKIPDAEILFISGTSESEKEGYYVDENGNVKDPTQAAINLRNQREFLNNVGGFKNRPNMRAILVTPKLVKAYGLNGLVQISYGKDLNFDIDTIPDINKVDLGFVAQVFVEQVGDKLFYVDKEGNQLGEFGKQLDEETLRKVIFQTMRTTKLTYNDNVTPRYRKDQKEEAEAYAEAWAKNRATIFATDPASSPTVYKFQVSRGIAEKGDVNNHVAGTLIDKKNETKILATDQTLIQIPTAGVVAHHTGQINMPNGRPVLVHQDNVEFLNNIRFKGKKALAVYEVIKQIADEITEQSKAGKKILVNKKLSRFLQNVLYWKEGKTQPETNQINIAEDGTSISFAGNKYAIPEIGERKDDIIEAIEKAFHNVNNKTLSPEMFSKPFTEYYMKDDELVSNEWTNYQTYLLSSTYPNGSARSVEDTPLSTKIVKPTEEIPYTHKQKYSTLIGLELPVGVIAKPAAAVVTTKGSEKVNTQFGEIPFSIDENGEPEFDEKDKTFLATRNKIIDAINTLRAKNGQPKASEQELLSQANGTITALVNQELQKPKPTEVKGTRKFNYKGEPNTIPTQFGDIVFSIDEDGDPVIDENNALNKATIKKVTDAIKKVRPDASKEELSKTVDATINTLVQNELVKDVPVPAAPVVQPTATEIKQVIDAREIATYGETMGEAYDYINHTLTKKLNNIVTQKAKKIAEEKGITISDLTEDDYRSIPEYNEVKRLNRLMDTMFSPDNMDEKTSDVVKFWEEQSSKKKRQSTAPVSTDAKADIERRRQETKNTITSEVIEGTTTPTFFANNDENSFIAETEEKIKQKIDDHYNAELAALEGGKPVEETSKEPGSFNVNNVKKRGNMFRKVGVLSKMDRMSEADLKAFKEWHAEKLPTIPFEILENMININSTEKAWGVFENGVAKFVKGGLRGTEYHEIGEAIWNGMLTPEEQAAILADERNRIGQFTDRETGKKYNYDDPTVSDQMLKERVLDDFSDFRLGKLPATSLGQKIVNFFRRMLEFFKQFIMRPSMKEQLFKAIEAGEFKDRQLSAESKSMPPQYRAAGHLTEEETNAYVKDMTAIASAIILGNGKIGSIDKSAIYNLRSLTSEDVFKKVEEVYEELGVRQELGDIAWKELVKKTKQELKVLLKVDFNEEDLININEGETNRNDYAREPFSTDWKKSAPVGIKFVSATRIERVPTNQENSNSFKLPDAKVNPKTQTYSLIPYGRVFSTMLDKLKNTSSIKKVISKIVNLANKDANYVSMFQTLGGNLETKTINFKDFKFEDWRLFIEMMQTYTKQKPNATVQYISQGQVYSGSALVTGIVNVTTRGWIQNMRNLSKDPDSIIGYNSTTKVYSIGDLSEIPTDTPQQKISFLSELGVIFPLEAFNKLKEEQQKTFTLTVANLKEYLQKTKEIMSVQKKTLDVAGQYNTLAELLIGVTHPDMENTRINLDGKQSNSFADNNTPSVFENEFNEVETLDELLTIRPELKDVYSKGSQLLKKGGQFFDKEGNRTSLELKVGYIEGTKNKDDNKGTISVKLNIGDRFTQEINQNVLGQYYIMVPADGSTEWMMNMGNNISFEDIEQGKDGWKQINKIFRGYLTDDVALALDADNRKQLKNVGNKAKELRFFKDILSEKTLSAINQMIVDGSTQQEIEKFIDENIDDVNASVRMFIEGTVQETRDILTQNGQIIFDKQIEGVSYYRYPNLNDNFTKKEGINKNKLVDSDILNVLTFANANYIINNIEFHKILFGDPYQFLIKEDGTLDATKRFKSFLSPRRTTIDSPELNTFLNENMNKAGDIELKPGDPGYHEYKSWIDTVTVSDVNIVGSIANMKNVPKEVRKAFAKTNEADSSSIIMDGTYRELKIKNGQWNIYGPEEAWHQWQMAYTRQNIPGYEYTDKTLEAHDKALVKTKEPKHTIEVLKPIVSGAKSGSNNINLVLDKFSQLPLYYSMVKGKNLEKLYMKMLKEKKGYIIMVSGRKVGAEALHDLYTPKGEFNDAAFNNNIEVSWKSYGIQVENTYEGDKEQTRGSQLTKISTLDLYENGEPIGETPERKEAIAKEVKRNKDVLDRLHKNGYERLLKRLGVEDLGGSYKITDKRRLAKTLQDEMFRRELSDNVKDSIQLDENGEFIIPFEASPAYLQIKSILYSFIDKEITSPKMHGGSYVQAPVTMWENAKEGRKIAIKTEDGYKQITREEYDKLSPEEQKKVILTDDTLKFYIDEDGKRYCEVLLPHWFKNKLGKHAGKSDKELIQFLNSTKEGRELLSGIGFRIPTQSLSSVEAFRVKGFLPQYMGKTVVVPSEVTTKAGSDFDIDKLNMYLKSIYIDKYGEMRIIRLKGTEETTRDFYGEVFEEKLARKRANKLELLDTVDALINDEEVSEEMLDKYGDYIDELFTSGIYDADEMMDMRDKIQEAFDKLTDDQVQNALKENFMSNMYRRGLENEYYDSLEKLATLPENFQRLISPVNDDGLKEISNKLDELRGYDENKIKNRLLNRNFMTSLRHAFVTAKRWVGIAAVNITGHSLTQKFQAFIDPERFNNVPLADRKILKYGNGEILLDHNKLEKNGKSYISLSGRLDAIGKFISDGLSGFATAFVDVAKDPYILKIIKSDLVVGTFMFLRRVGVPKEQLAMFMNQPIIDEYLTMLDNKGVRSLFDSRYISAIQMKFPTTVTQEDLDGFNKSELADNIKNYYANNKQLNDYKNHEQQNIFQEFLKYAKMAEYSFKFTQASNYDTTKFQSGDSLQLKQWRTEIAQDKNIISSVKELLESNFIGVQADYLDRSMDAMGEVLVLETPEFIDVTNEVLKSFEQDMFLSKDKFDKIANKIKASFLDYIIQKRSDVAANLKKQLVDDKESVAQMLVKAQRDFPGVKLLEDLEVDSSGRVGGAQTIKLRVNDKVAYNENMYQGMMRELRDDPRTNALYKGIVRLAILQGTYQSAISIKNIIPVEDYSAHITPILAGLRVDNEIRAFAKTYEFQRNEWQDNDIVPIVEPRFAEETQTQAEEDAGLPRRFQGLYKVVGMGKNRRKVPGPFPTIKELGAITNKRDLLFINSKYQAKASNYDVVKVPRTIPIDKKKADEGKIDIATGLEITNQTYADHIKRGDLSLRNYYGYQKVKYADGSPLVAYYDQEGNPVYVYKFINLHGDGMYAAEYYGDGRPSVFANGSQKNVKKIEGTTVSNEISDQAIIDYYGGEVVPQDEADPIIATIERESQNIVPLQSSTSIEPKGQKVKEGIYVNQAALTKDEQLELFNYLKPFLEAQGKKTNKGANAPIMIGLGLRWDYKSNNPDLTPVNVGKNLAGKATSYAYYDLSINGQTLGKITPRFIELMNKTTGVDISNYDGAIINLYTENSLIGNHSDLEESATAEKYPVVVANIGGEGNIIVGSGDSAKRVSLSSGAGYLFGFEGKARKIPHSTYAGEVKGFLPKISIAQEGKNFSEGSYRISITMRRVMPLEPGMPTSPVIKATQPTTEDKKELFSAQEGLEQKSFRGKPLNFVDKIPTKKETILAMSNNRQTGIITIDLKAMEQKFVDKAWTKPAKQLDGSYATALSENEFGTFNEWFTFALVHETKHDTILQQEGETTGQYEDRINQAALADIKENYNVPTKTVSSEVVYKDKAKRIRVEYPKIIQVMNSKLDSSKLIEVSKLSNYTDVFEADILNYSVKVGEKFGPQAERYADIVNGEITNEEGEFFKNNPEFADELLEAFENDELADGESIDSYAQKLLNQNEKLVDTAQMSLFDPNNDDLEGADKPNPCGQS